MAPSSKPAKGSSGKKKEKVFHPQSRKAGQLVRTHIRKTRLEDLAKKRSHKQSSQVDVLNFFFNALPPEGELSLEELHVIVRDIWLARHDEELEQERAARRKGRPKSAKEQKLEEIKLKEVEEYRTGLEIPDLMHEVNVELFRKWDQKQAGYLQLLRFIRISSSDPQNAVLSRSGKHPLLISVPNPSVPISRNETMITDDFASTSLLSNTMMTTDG